MEATESELSGGAGGEAFMLRTLPLRAQPATRVDREGRVIYGVSVAQPVEALGHGMALDARSIAAIVEHGNAARNGVKSRFAHPGLSSNGLGKYLGRMRDFRQEGDKAVADLHLADSAFRTPEGDLGNYVMDMAENDPDMFGMSVVIKGKRVWTLSDGTELDGVDGAGNPIARPALALTDVPVVRVRQLLAVDAVDEPAANRDGLFAARHLLATNSLSQEAFEDIDEYLGGIDVTPQRAFEFALSYFAARGVNLQEFRQMAEKEQEKGAPVEAGENAALAEMQSQLAALQAELAARAERESELAAKLTQANERVSKLEGDALREKLAALAEGWYGDAGKHVDMLLKLAQLDGEGGESFQFYVQTQNALAEQVRQSDLFKERGTDKPAASGSAVEQANRLAALRVKDEGITLSAALERVFGEQPDLYSRYVREVSQRGGA